MANQFRGTLAQCCLGLLLAGMFSAFALAAQGAVHDEPAKLVFELYAEIGPDSEVQLINGVTAKRKDWPAIIIAPLDHGRCSAALIGPGVFVTAAHCFDRGLDRPLLDNVRVEAGGQALVAHCTLAPDYIQGFKNKVESAPRAPDDFALCSFTLPAAMPEQLQALQHEVLQVDTPLAAGDAVLMTGYGCSRLADLGAASANEKALTNAFRIGNAKVYAGAAAQHPQIEIRSAVSSAPVLCDGDSGGPLISGVTQTDEGGTRRVRGVNSTVEVLGGVAISRITPLSSTAFKNFARQWLSEHPGKEICGLNAQAGFLPCRQ
ncbi:trypsin-like serine protease [Pseudomonas fakonensis]|uniref:Trypsin-like serine protease n=1 Tax=Pseudomonas fakonensis TaxID=2842355 RepID=A0ABX8ND60_9PSED|nr:trypsin-like serine protease [Pseudomonas fakonensis]QXH53443.1 trypsin-like serine protease [Pseudomonas fakonensis]